MQTLLIASLALALVLAVIALVHQVRLRQALEKLLKMIFHKWRDHVQQQDRGRRDNDSHRRNGGL